MIRAIDILGEILSSHTHIYKYIWRLNFNYCEIQFFHSFGSSIELNSNCEKRKNQQKPIQSIHPYIENMATKKNITHTHTNTRFWRKTFTNFTCMLNKRTNDHRHYILGQNIKFIFLNNNVPTIVHCQVVVDGLTKKDFGIRSSHDFLFISIQLYVLEISVWWPIEIDF